MKFLNTKHKRKSAIITTIIMLVILLLIFQFGLDYKDPPDEYGVEINFGYTDAGSGNNTTSTEEVKTDQAVQQQEQQEETPKEPVEEQPIEKVEETPVEEVITQDTEDAPTVNNTPTTQETTKPANTKPTETTEPVKPVKPPSLDESTTNAMNNILHGPTNNGTSTEGDGDSNQAGNQGDVNGNPYASSYYGGGSGNGSGFGLNGRTKKSNQKFPQDCNEEGKVVVEITVNNSGKVINTRVAQSDDPCLNAAAKKTARSYKFNADSKAPSSQKGFVVVNFNLGE